MGNAIIYQIVFLWILIEETKSSKRRKKKKLKKSKNKKRNKNRKKNAYYDYDENQHYNSDYIGDKTNYNTNINIQSETEHVSILNNIASVPIYNTNKSKNETSKMSQSKSSGYITKTKRKKGYS